MTVIVIPVEVYAREIDHKVLLGLYLSRETGCKVLIARAAFANHIAKQLGASAVYVGKNIFVSSHNIARVTEYEVDNRELVELLVSGCYVVFTDEEGGLHFRCNYSELDKYSLLSRLPVKLSKSLPNLENLSLCHWGSYQTDIAQGEYPQLRHHTSGSLHADAAKLYARYFQSNNRSIDLIGITSSATILGEWAHQHMPLYLALDKFNDQLGDIDFLKRIQSEIMLPGLCSKLSCQGLNVIYRPHPGSCGTTVSEWIEYCKREGIQTSNPTTMTALDYLSKLSVNIHTSCSTSISSYFLKQPTICYKPNTQSKTDVFTQNITEAIAENDSDVFNLLKLKQLPELNQCCAMQLHGALTDEIVTFPSILKEVQRFVHKASSVSDLDIELLKLRLNIWSAKKSAKSKAVEITKQSSRFTKFKRIYKEDVMRNMLIADRAWPLQKSQLVHYTQDSCILSAS